MKIIHFADVHYCREYKDLALASLRVLLETGMREGVDLWALAGDLFDRSIANTDKDGFPELVEVITQMLNVAPMVAVKGTITHDVPGCYDVLTRIKAGHNFTVLEPGLEYYLAEDNDEDMCRFVSCGQWSKDDKLLILGLPEPTKAHFLAGTNGIGKDEANEKIKQGLREILLGYGAVRKNNPSIPCLFLYHGLVDGASTCTGQTLTGDIGVSRDDLALVNADYIALGHIHKAQQVPGLPAFFSGSVYPVDWGELDQKQFNLVTLSPFDSEMWESGDPRFVPHVDHLPFPHAPRKKITFDGDDTTKDVDANEYAGFQTWLDIKGKTKNGFNCETMLACILKEGALPGSRVTFTEIPTETVRAVEIQGVKSLTEKISVWARNSELEVRVSVLEKAYKLEAEAKRTGLLPQPHAWRLQKVRTRGLKGIRRGMGLDEYEIDFQKFGPGLIALVAENGTGKTTMMLNCHMYPSMLTSEKKLQDYFCLRDSYREVFAIDDMTGTEYRGMMLIDGKNASGKAEYYLDVKREGQWVPITTGKTKDYEEKITELFGSEGLYLRSAFIPSKPSPRYPDLSYVAQGEKKRIFYELSGIGFYATYCDRAKAEAKSLRSELESHENAIKNGEGLLQRISDLSQSRAKLVHEVDANTIELANIEAAGNTAKVTLEHFAAIVKANGETKAKIDTLKIGKEGHNSDLATWEQKWWTAKSFTTPEGEAKRKKAIGDIADAEAIREQIQLWVNDATEKIRKRSGISETYAKAIGMYHITAKAIEDPRATATQEVVRLQGDRKAFITYIDHLIESLSKELNDKCPTCNKPLTQEEMKPLIKEREALEAELKLKQEKVFALDQDIEAQKRIIETKTAEFKALVFPEVPDNTELNTLIAHSESEARNGKELLSKIDVVTAKAIVKAADEARTGIVEAESQIKAITEKIEACTREIEKLEIGLDPEADRLHYEASEKLETIRKRYRDMNAVIASAQGQIKSITDEIENKKTQQQEIEALKIQVEKSKSELRDWEFLVEACGIDGIPALELDAVAPEISQAANSLLENAYGQRFQIEFRTTKISGTGSKKKQVEDFAIWITDAKDGWTQPYETLSGGEETWIKKAISDAFEIIKAKNTGVKFLTVFQDELDGKLSPHNRQVFFKLLEKTHEQTGRYHTVVVTHSEQVQEQIAQKIEMRKAVTANVD